MLVNTEASSAKQHYTADPMAANEVSGQVLRERYLLSNLFRAGELNLVSTDLDRAVVGGAVPLEQGLSLPGMRELDCEYFCERRELGIVNTGGNGRIIADGQEYAMHRHDCLYVGRGSREITLESDDSQNPAAYYLLSYPAHREYPTTHASRDAALPARLGSPETSNERTIYKYIHPGGIPSCQLTLGVTILETGSVWNTMPPHTHTRRTEVYLYFDLAEDQMVVHLMGRPESTRHLIVRNREATLSPAWSIHAGAGTSNYSFIWGMGGENQKFDDMDHLAIDELL